MARLDGPPRTPEEHVVVAACERTRAEVAQSGGDVGDAHEFYGSTSRVPLRRAVLDSAPQEKCLALYRMARALRPARVVEFGAAFGISGGYLAVALRDNGAGELVTVEASQSRWEIAQRSIDSLAPGIGVVLCSLFDDVLDRLDGAGLFFLDGNHYADPTERYLAAAVERMGRPGWVVLDDVVGYSAEMSASWARLRADRRFALATMVAGMGVLTLEP